VRRSQRRVHRALWWLLALVIAATIIAALAARARVERAAREAPTVPAR
jgi:hypothetical protein